MSDSPPYSVDLEKWVEKARRDSVNYRERQATEVILNAVAAMPDFGGRLFLKGGLLLSIRYDSPRTTTDIDFTCDLAPTPKAEISIHAALDKALPAAAARLGYAELALRVQSVKGRSNTFGSPGMSFPSLKIKIGYAGKNTPEFARLMEGAAPGVIELDVSFNEPVCRSEPLRLEGTGNILLSYALTDLVAEKFRSLLQQPLRRRNRRQDLYDIALLIDRHTFDSAQKAAVLEALLTKSVKRIPLPNKASLSDREVARRAQADWLSLRQEIGEVPDFDVCFAKVDGLYRSLPWPPSARDAR
jgi:predicted nucleotidyltransferase component of viral defense system